ncbi:hypothetical protein MKEN_00978100 [Mycena kentingensis (nom. inval.)]|nr:hypothetical protein MKEN_00978100 [Mycena kentingensis (nom. inval.)]
MSCLLPRHHSVSLSSDLYGDADDDLASPQHPDGSRMAEEVQRLPGTLPGDLGAAAEEAGGGGWANTPAHAHGQPPAAAAAAWANTPTPWGGGGGSAGAPTPIHQGWGSMGAGAGAGAATPYGQGQWPPLTDPWTTPAPSTSAHAHGFSALAAPPMAAGMSSAPMAGWGNFGGAPMPGPSTPFHHGRGGGGGVATPYDLEPGEEFYDYEAEEAAERQADAAWAAHERRMSGGHAPRRQEGWANDPNAWTAGAAGGGAAAGWAAGAAPAAGWAAGGAPAAGWAQGGAPAAGWAAGGAPAAWPGWADDPRYDLRRSHSAGTPKHQPKRERAHSLSAHSPHPSAAAWAHYAHHGHLPYDETNLAKRPISWRSDYPGIGDASTRGGAVAGSSGGGGLTSLFRRKSSVSGPAFTTGTEAGDWHDPKKRTLCSPLTYTPASASVAGHMRHHIAYDLRTAPESTPPGRMGAFIPRGPDEMMQPAMLPPGPRMRIVFARCPWYVDVKAQTSAAGYVTLYDVLSAMHAALDKQIESKDYFNKAVSKDGRDRLTRAFVERCERSAAMMIASMGPERDWKQEEVNRGVKRIDFLGGECFFVGLVRAGGVWEAKCVREIAQ